MPIRRVFGTAVFDVHERVDMPRPGEMRAGSFHRARARPGLAPRLRTARARASRPSRLALNRLQFLTIRRYLTLVFCALILLLIVVAAWR